MWVAKTTIIPNVLFELQLNSLSITEIPNLKKANKSILLQYLVILKNYHNVECGKMIIIKAVTIGITQKKLFFSVMMANF